MGSRKCISGDKDTGEEMLRGSASGESLVIEKSLFADDTTAVGDEE